MRLLIGLGTLTVALALDSGASAGPKEQKLLADYTVLTDRDGHYLLVDERSVDEAIAKGHDGAVASTVHVVVGNKLLAWPGEWWTIPRDEPRLSLADPRGKSAEAYLRRSAKTGWSLECLVGPPRSLTPVPPAIKKRILGKSRVGKRRYRWTPRILARDRNAFYYVVEELEGSAATTFRLLHGARAQLKPAKTVRLAADPLGFVIVTKVGTMRFSNSDGTLRFTDAKGVDQPLDLMNLQHNPNVRKFLLDELGPYHGVRFESACEVMAPGGQ